MKIELIKAFKSLNMKKPRITKGLKLNGLEVVKIEKLENDYKIHLQDGDYQEVKSWETIKRFNKLTVKQELAILKSDIIELSNFHYREKLATYNELSNFYYDSLGSDYLTTTEKSLEN